MQIIFSDWTITLGSGRGPMQYDDGELLEVINAPSEWTWTLNAKLGGDLEVIPLAETDGKVGATLTAGQLALAGNYLLQLVGKRDGTTKHTNVISMTVLDSLSGDAQWPELPTVFSEAVERAEKAAGRAEDAAANAPVPDWNQNDESADDFVKNRTHYAEVIPHEFDLGSIEFTEGYISLDSPPWELIIGKTYDVVWDGTVYPCECTYYVTYGRVTAYLGNRSIESGSSSEDTGEPFYLTSSGVLRASSLGTHSMKVSYTTEVVHKLDPKYLDDVESALTENSQAILNKDVSQYVTTSNKSFVMNNEWTQVIKTNKSTYAELDLMNHKVFVFIVPDGATYEDYLKTKTLTCLTYTGSVKLTPIKSDGSAVTSEDLPYGVTVLILGWHQTLYLVNPRVASEEAPV